MSALNTIAARTVVGDHVRPRITARIVICCALSILAEGYDVGIVGASLLALQVEPGWTSDPVMLGMLSSASLLGMLIGAAVVGTYASTKGLRQPLALCVAGFSLASIGCGLAPNPLVFALFRFLGGIAMGGIVPVAASYTIEFSPHATRLRNYGLMYSGYSLGIMLVATLAITMIPAFGWRSLFLLGGVPLLLAPFLLAVMPESLQFLVSRGREAEARALALRLGIDDRLIPALMDKGADEAPSSARATLGVLFSPRYARASICFWLALAMALMLIYAAGTWLPSLMRARGLALGSSLATLAVFSLAGAAGGIASGWLADRLGQRRVIALSFTAGGIAFAALSHVEASWAAFLFAGLAGYGSVATGVTLAGYTTSWYPAHIRTSAIGWALGFGRFGAIAGPIVTGLIMSLSGENSSNALLALAGLAVLPALLVMAIPRQDIAR